MNRQYAIKLLIQDSKNRRLRASLPAWQKLELQLGHLMEYHTDESPWQGLIPGREKWEATYQADALTVARPLSGTALHGVCCTTCGCIVAVAVRSRRSIFLHYLAVAGIVTGAFLFSLIVLHDTSVAYAAGVIAFYALIIRELTGKADYHSAAHIVNQSQAGHRLWLAKDE
jgi:hypothetical protein